MYFVFVAPLLPASLSRMLLWTIIVNQVLKEYPPSSGVNFQNKTVQNSKFLFIYPAFKQDVGLFVSVRVIFEVVI